jgi:hypothetical protein
MIMTDLLYLSIALIFFAASWALIIGCEKLMEE